MKRLTYVLGIALLSTFVACQNTNNKENANKEEATIEATATSNNETNKKQKASPGKLQLNEGEKWAINKEMLPHIKKGEQVIKDYLKERKEDYHRLAENLKKANAALIQSCTMKGEAHETLHHWLHPHLDLTKELLNASSLEEAKPIIEQIKVSYKTFHHYFE